jgi:hypothetical protein
MISLFKLHTDTQSTENIGIQDYIDNIKNGTWQDSVLNVRAGKLEKNKLPALTISGVFKERKAAQIIEHSGFICIDVDAKDQICKIDIDAIKQDPYVYAVHLSVGGFGYAVLIKIDPEKHLEAFLSLENYFFVNYSIVVDKSCKDTSRLRYVSYDPDIYVNEKAKVFKKYLPKKEVKKREVKTFVVKSDFDEMVNKASSMNLFDDYQNYIQLAFALTSEFGEGGRMYFHQLCSSSSKYDYTKADSHYNKAMSRSGSGITIASVYHIFKTAGIPLTSQKTEQIKSIVKLADNPKQLLAEMGIFDDENLIAKFEKPTEEKTEIDEIIELIKMNKIKFNEITRNFELNGVNLDDRLLAKFYSSVWQKIDDSISKDKIWTLIMSKENTPTFNPIHDWFEQNKYVSYDNEFQKLIECFTINPVIFVKDKEKYVDDYLDVYLKKWLLGVIGSAHGTYSLMILVLIGEQGTNKTEFFRNLLPDDLKKYYAESNLDEGKDSEILMCKKLLIVDDEFGGKSKKDATKLKRLSSQQTFSIRAPYGRISEDLNRLAVLGGTSNDPEVINDPTGNRRIIPINIISFDLEKYKEIDKTKLFIELYNEWRFDKKAWFLSSAEINFLNQINIKNTEVCIEDEILAGTTEHPFAELTATDIKISIEMKYPTIKTNTKRIGMALKKLNFAQTIVKRNGNFKRIYKISLNFD